MPAPGGRDVRCRAPATRPPLAAVPVRRPPLDAPDPLPCPRRELLTMLLALVAGAACVLVLAGPRAGPGTFRAVDDGAAGFVRAEGYDAEGSYSPTGRKIVFASNRNAYSKKLTADERKIFERDKSYFNDIYLMNSDGTGLEQLTSSAGYDGGPFFNSHGDQICWRRFSPNGHKAEIYRMNLDSRKEKKITNLTLQIIRCYINNSTTF